MARAPVVNSINPVLNSLRIEQLQTIVAVVDASGTAGRYTTIEAGVASGAAFIFVKSGTYNPVADITLSNQVLIGENPKDTIIQLGSWTLRLEQRAAEYTAAGVPAVTPGSAVVTGAGTAYNTIDETDGIVMLLERLAQVPVDNIGNATQLALESAWRGLAISPAIGGAIPANHQLQSNEAILTFMGNFTIVHASLSATAAIAVTGAGVRVSNVKMRLSFLANDIGIEVGATPGNALHTLIENCEITGGGTGVQTNNATYTIIKDCNFTNQGAAAVDISRFPDSFFTTVENCSIASQAAGIIVGGNGEGHTVRGCTISYCTVGVSQPGGGTPLEISVTESTFRRCATAVGLTSCSRAIIRGNQIFDCGSGITSTAGASHIVTENIIREFLNNGIWIASEQSIIAHNILVSVTVGTGNIAIYSSGVKTVIKGNVVENCGTGITATADRSGVEGNIIIDMNTAMAIALVGDECKASGNHCEDTTTTGIWISGNHCEVSDNVIENSGTVAIDSNGTHCLIRGNRSRDNVTLAGIDSSGARAIIEGNSVENAAAEGINCTGVNTIIKGNMIEAPVGDGIATTGANGKISENLITDAGAEGIDSDGNDTTITSNTIDNATGDGINAVGTDSTIGENAISSSGGIGIDSSSDRVTITANTIWDPTGAAIVCAGGQCTITGNTATSPGGAGITTGGANVTIQGNRINGCGATAISSTGSGSALTGNSINGPSAGNGMTTSGSFSTISGNTISGCAGDGINAAGASSVVNGNTIRNPGGGGVVGGGTDMVISNNEISIPGGTGITAGTLITVSNNRIITPSIAGIAILGTRSTVEGNLITDAGGRGIDIDASYARVIGNDIHSPGNTAIDCDANSDYSIIANNTISDGGNRGINVEGEGTEVRGNTMEIVASIGIRSTSIRNVIEGNIINNNTADEGIYAGGDQVTISGNQLNDIAETPILLVSSSQSAVVGNTIRTWGAGFWGIDITGAPSLGVTVSANALFSVSTGGIRTVGSVAIVTGNMVEAVTAGILSTGDDVSITGNNVNDVLADGIEVTGDRSTISGNSVFSSNHNGIDVSGEDTSITGNTLRGTVLDAIIYAPAAASEGGTISGNDIRTPAECGIKLGANAQSVAVVGNGIWQCGEDGIEVDGDDNCICSNAIGNCIVNGIEVLAGSNEANVMTNNLTNNAVNLLDNGVNTDSVHNHLT